MIVIFEYFIYLPKNDSKQMTTTDKSSSRTTAFDPKDVPPAESIRQQLSRILASPRVKGHRCPKILFHVRCKNLEAARPKKLLKGLCRSVKLRLMK
jgi:hypothetical protein